MIHWDDLKYVLALEENGNLIKAATQLKTNPTTVSRHIKRISEDYKRTLFTRTSNGEWSLTDQGREFAEAAKHCQKVIEQLGSEESRPVLREITLSTTEFIAATILAPRMGALKDYDADLTLTLDTRDRNVSLAFGEADMAIRLARPKSGRLIGAKICDLKMGVFAPIGTTPRGWVGLPAELDWVPEMQLGLAHFGCPPSIRMGSFAGIRRTASECNLACIGPQNMMQNARGLAQVQGSAIAIREVWSVYHESRRNDPTLGLVRDWVKSCFVEIDVNDAPMAASA